jgi:lanthanide-dependent methanol dehydrogenase
MNVTPVCRLPVRGCLLAVVVLGAIPGCRHSEAAPAPVSLPTGASANAAAGTGQWTMAAHDFAHTRFSEMADITPGNARGLAPVWQVALPGGGGAATPLIAGGTLYVATAGPTIVLAFDLARAGAIRWRTTVTSDACCGEARPGLTYSGTRLFVTAPGGVVAALDPGNGRELWRRTPASPGDTLADAPLLIRDRVIVANRGGARGWLAALDAGNGRELWRAWSTGSDADVLVGMDFDPFYPADRGADLGVQSWLPGAWQTGGGATPGAIAYDGALDLLYYGTGSPAPANHERRPGDNKWTSGAFARDARSGEARWFYQWSPHDRFQYSGGGAYLLLELPDSGGSRAVVLHPGRNGLLYVLDRRTGEVLAADAFGPATTSFGVDAESGRPVADSALFPRTGRTTRLVCPAAPGDLDEPAAAFSPPTGLVFLAHSNLCMDIEPRDSHDGAPVMIRRYPGPGGHRAAVTAWDPVTRRAAWQVRETEALRGMLVTAGGLAWYGTADGRLRALDAASGAAVWERRLGTAIHTPPVTYRAPDGRQQVAVIAADGSGRTLQVFAVQP